MLLALVFFFWCHLGVQSVCSPHWLVSMLQLVQTPRSAITSCIQNEVTTGLGGIARLSLRAQPKKKKKKYVVESLNFNKTKKKK